jgi:hypothetical protein
MTPPVTTRYAIALVVVVSAGLGVVPVDLGTASPLSHSFPTFFTPARRTFCKLDTNIAGVKPFTPYLNCWRPRDGFTVTLGPRKRPLFGTLDAHKGPLESVILRRWLLPFGATWWGNRVGEQGRGSGRGDILYRCASRTTGLTYRNAAGHGFWLGRTRGHRIF